MTYLGITIQVAGHCLEASHSIVVNAVLMLALWSASIVHQGLTVTHITTYMITMAQVSWQQIQLKWDEMHLPYGKSHSVFISGRAV